MRDRLTDVCRDCLFPRLASNGLRNAAYHRLRRARIAAERQPESEALQRRYRERVEAFRKEHGELECQLSRLTPAEAEKERQLKRENMFNAILEYQKRNPGA